MFIVNRLTLSQLLIEQRQADFTGTDDSHDLFKLGNLPCVGGLVPQHPYMVGRAASVNIVGPLAQQIEHLRKGQSHKEIIGLRSVRDDKEHRRFPIPDAVKLQLVIGHDLPKLGDVKGSQPCAAGNKDRLCCFAAGQFVLFILLDRKAIRLSFFQARKHIVHGVHKILVILLDLHPGNHVNQGVHVPILGGALKNDIGDEGAVKQGFRFCPEWIAFLAFAFCVGNESVHKFKNVGLVADVRQRVIVHGFCEINGIEHLDPIPTLLQEVTHLPENASFGIDTHIAASAVFICAGLQNLRGKPEPGFAGAGRTDHTGIEIAGVGRIFRTGIHGKELRPGQNDVVFKLWIYERGYIFRTAPTG